MGSEVGIRDGRQIVKEVDDADAAKQLVVAITYKGIDDLTQTDAAALYGFSSSWASKWFTRLERLAEEPFEEVVYDEQREGRPPKLSDEEYDQFVEALQESPEEVGIDAPAWTPALAQNYLEETYGVEYSIPSCRRLLKEAGLSYQQPRRSATEADENNQEEVHDERKKVGDGCHSNLYRSNLEIRTARSPKTVIASPSHSRSTSPLIARSI
jgi:transposase